MLNKRIIIDSQIFFEGRATLNELTCHLDEMLSSSITYYSKDCRDIIYCVHIYIEVSMYADDENVHNYEFSYYTEDMDPEEENAPNYCLKYDSMYFRSKFSIFLNDIYQRHDLVNIDSPNLVINYEVSASVM